MGQDNLSDLEELLRIAESSENKENNKASDVDKYVQEFNITEGNTAVPARAIYYHYRKWRKKKKYLSGIAFFIQFSKSFTKGTHNRERVYYLDSKPFDMTQEGLFKARSFLRKERREKNKEKSKS